MHGDKCLGKGGGDVSLDIFCSVKEKKQLTFGKVPNNATNNLLSDLFLILVEIIRL